MTAQTTARITKQGKHFEVLVDLDESLKIRKGEGGNINAAVLTEAVFHNLKSGEQVSETDLENNFGTSVLEEVAEKIIKNGEVVLPSEYLHEQQDKKYKQVVDFLVKNSVSPEGRPYTPDRIMQALKEAKVDVKNKPVEQQVGDIMDQLAKVLPIKIETKKVRLLVPARYTGKAYGVVNEFKESEDWKSNGDLEIVVSMPTAMIFDFYDKINSATDGSVMSEELKE